MKLVLVICLALFASLVQAQTYLFDDFSDGNADGWVEDSTGATYEVTDSLTYRFSYSGGQDIFAHSYWGTVMPAADYTIIVNFVGHGPTTHIGFNGRLDPGQMTAYVAYADYGSDDLVICKYDPAYVELATATFNFAYDTGYCLKFDLSGTTLSAKVWEMGGTEPTSWMVQTTDGDFTDPGYVALEAFRAPSGSFRADFYDVFAGDISALDQSTWGAIKATF
jgi:hypothetical protein